MAKTDDVVLNDRIAFDIGVEVSENFSAGRDDLLEGSDLH
jgi:hypothetical protein